jgi:hypothetical protein
MDNKFVEILAKIDPEKKILTESVQTELVTLMEAKDKQIKETAFTEASKVMDKKIAQLNEEHEAKIKTELEKQNSELTVKAKTLVESIDKKHVAKLEKFIEVNDKVKTEKLRKAIKKIDESNTTKLEMIVGKCKTKIEELKKMAVSDKIVESVDGFLNEYIKEVLPAPAVVNEAKLNRLEKMYGQMREIVMVNDETFQTEVKEAILDAKKIIEEKEGEIDGLMFEKISLKKKLNKIEAERLLENKTQSLSPKTKAYLEVCFKDADVKEIEERFDEAVKAFKDEESKRRTKIVNESASKKKIVDPVKSKEDVIKPIVEQSQPKQSNIMDAYAGTVTKLARTSILD